VATTTAPAGGTQLQAQAHAQAHISAEDWLFIAAAGVALYSFTTGRSSIAPSAVSSAPSAASPTTVPNTPPVAAPGAPVSLTQTGATTSSVTLTWAPVDGAVEYQVWQLNPETLLAQVTTNTATIQNLQANSHYVLFVVAIGATGLESEPSQPITVTTASTAQTPTVPSIPGGFTVQAVSPTSITFSWLEDPGATYYQIQNNTTGQISSPIAGTSATIAGLEPNTTYQFALLACNSVGCSNPSSLVQATTATGTGPGTGGTPTAEPPSPPTGLTQSGTQLCWQPVSGATSYSVVSASGQVLASGLTSTCVTWTSLFSLPLNTQSGASTAQVSVVACNAYGCSAPSSPVTLVGVSGTSGSLPAPASSSSGASTTAAGGSYTFVNAPPASTTGTFVEQVQPPTIQVTQVATASGQPTQVVSAEPLRSYYALLHNPIGALRGLEEAQRLAAELFYTYGIRTDSQYLNLLHHPVGALGASLIPAQRMAATLWYTYQIRQ